MGLQYCPWQHAKELGLVIEERRLPARRRGEYHHHDKLILLAPGMSRREARSTLAHEVQHAITGDLPTPFGLRHTKQELRARRKSALLLVDVYEYAQAEQIREGHVFSIAYDLNVTAQIILDWQHFYPREDPSSSMALRAMVRSACW